MIKKLRNITISYLSLLALIGMTITDGGDCARILAEFELTNGEVIKGYVHTNRLDFEAAEKDFRRFLHCSYADVKILDSIVVYEKLDTLRSIAIKNHKKECDFSYLACPMEQVKKMSFDDWDNGKIIEKFSCGSCSSKNQPYAAGGYSPIVITELNGYEIERLKEGTALENCVINQNDRTTIHLTSLDGRYDKDQMKAIYIDLAKKHNYFEIKEELRKSGIAMFRVFSIA